jgi:hypothetical protein
MGFDAFIFGRLDFQDQENRQANKEMEFVWRPMYDTLGDSVQIFSSALYAMYWAPPGFGFDTLD